MENLKEINLNNNYVILDDFENLERKGEVETRHSDNDILNFSAISESSNISNISFVMSQLKSASDYNFIFKILFFLVYCNPFVKFLINIFYKYYYNLPTSFNIENILSKKENKIVSFITIIFLLISNFGLIYGNICDEHYLRICLFLVNNCYLLYFLIAIYGEDKLRKNERKNSWDKLINVLD